MSTLEKFLVGIAVTGAIVFVAFFGRALPSPTPGATPGPDISSPFLTVNGVKTWYNRQAMKTATTTVCAIKSPAATSTLVDASAQFSVSTTSASVITMARGATAYATTSIIGSQVAVSAGAQVTMIGTTTAPGSIFAPNTFFVVGMQGNPGTYSPSGYCQAVFREL